MYLNSLCKFIKLTMMCVLAELCLVFSTADCALRCYVSLYYAFFFCDPQETSIGVFNWIFHSRWTSSRIARVHKADGNYVQTCPVALPTSTYTKGVLTQKLWHRIFLLQCFAGGLFVITQYIVCYHIWRIINYRPLIIDQFRFERASKTQNRQEQL